MNENELAAGLRAAAGAVDARPDLAEVELGAGRVRTRRRVVGGVTAAMLVAAAGGVGFGIGRAAEGDDLSVASPESAAADTQSDAANNDIEPGDGAEPTRAETTANVPSTNASAPQTTVPYGTDVGRDAGAMGGDMAATSSMYMPGPYVFVSERSALDGLRVRALHGEDWGMGDWRGGWQPARFCWPTADLRVTIDGPSIVDIVGAGYYAEMFDGLEATPADAGWADGRPLRILMVQTTLGEEVAVTWADGASDRAQVVGGVGVLVVEGSNAYDTDYTVEVTGANGTTTRAKADFDHSRNPDYRTACEEPPPPLPAPGEQPADVAAADAAVRARFDELRAREVAWPDKSRDLLDDWTGVEEAAAQVASGDYADAAGSATFIIDELVFTAPTEAWIRYTIDSSSGVFSGRYSTATLVDGVWQFPRASACQDLGLAGGACEPWVDQIYPPSWYERYGGMSECSVGDDGVEMCAGSGEVFVPEG